MAVSHRKIEKKTHTAEEEEGSGGGFPRASDPDRPTTRLSRRYRIVDDGWKYQFIVKNTHIVKRDPEE